ncbi:MAG: hypothetical protein IH874_08265 [Candidatus Dadabacteria bacterium]|nr:hypothetical protein [Candidatus Dadabacteria bacterium]
MNISTYKNTLRKSEAPKPSPSKKIIILIVLAVFVALGYIHLKVEEIKLGYGISENKRKEERLIRENQIMLSEYMNLKRPSRISKIALDMGYKFPTQEDVIYTDQITIIGEGNE